MKNPPSNACTTAPSDLSSKKRRAVTLPRREVTIQSAWDRAIAVHPFAVHFCSLKCKDSYMAELFAPDSAAEERIIERTAPAEILVERSGPELHRVTTKSPKLKVHRTKRAA